MVLFNSGGSHMFIHREGTTQSSIATHFLECGCWLIGLLINLNLTLTVLNRTSWHGDQFSSADFVTLIELWVKVFSVCVFARLFAFVRKVWNARMTLHEIWMSACGWPILWHCELRVYDCRHPCQPLLHHVASFQAARATILFKIAR